MDTIELMYECVQGLPSFYYMMSCISPVLVIHVCCILPLRKENPDPELIFSMEANDVIPIMVIEFYESKLKFDHPVYIPSED